MVDFVNLLVDYGLPTAFLFLLGWWFIKKDAQHRKDLLGILKDHREDTKLREDRYANLTEKNNNVLSELRTMIHTFIDINK